MSKKKPARLDDLLKAAFAYWNEEQRYTEAVMATELGRQTSALRDKARFEHRRDDPAASHQLYEQAARMHLPPDQSVAAGAARHDLAESYKNRTAGIHVENLLRAKTLYEASLQCNARNAFPSRRAMTCASLASCLRQLAAESADAEQEASFSKEAKSLLTEAIAISEKRGAAGWSEAISYLNTLGNLLAQQELFNTAVTTFERAESAINRLRRLLATREQDHARAKAAKLPPFQRMALSAFVEHVQDDRALELVLFSAAQTYMARNHEGDRMRARKLLEDVIHTVPDECAGPARLALGRLLRMEGNPASAREVLRSVSHANLPIEVLPQLAKELVLLGEEEAALQILHEVVEAAIEQRKEHVADYPADHLAQRAQTAAAAAARIYADRKQPTEAFLVLERCAGFRYEEALRHFIWRPADRLTRELWERRWRLATAAGLLESLASRATYVDPQHVIAFLKDTREALQARGEASPQTGPSHSEHGDYVQALTEQLDGACLALDPIQDLRSRGKALKEIALALDNDVAARDPRGFRRWHVQQVVSNEISLLKLLQATPDQALFRFSLREDLLVIGVWLRAGQIQCRAVRVDVPEKLLSDLWALRDNPSPEQIDYSGLTQALQAMDISAVFPAQNMRRAIVLPSIWASFLPLAALGPPGKALLDRFDSVLYMPSTAGLWSRQDTHRPRTGSLVVIPKKTFSGIKTDLDEVAFASPLPGERYLCGDAATLAAVADGLRAVDVLAVYSHGQHEGDTGPYLELRDGKLDTTLGSQQHWEGLERVELWGCQSGVNMPHDPLTPNVDEGFGFDYTLLSFGVRTALGTLWKVSEIVTAYIVRCYRAQLAQGSDAASALAHAQRRWRDHGIAQLDSYLRESVDPAAGIRDFLLAQGIAADQVTLGNTLGAGKRLTAAEIQPYLAWFACPATWGGYRFLGVPEQRARRAWTEEDERPLTEPEWAEVSAREEIARRATVENLADDSPSPSAEQATEADLQHAMTLLMGERPTPEQALQVARRYADRLLSAHDHNLLCGLAWLHEALCDPGLAAEWRHRLSLEAAHLWLELAEGESVTPADLIWPRCPHAEALLRARTLLQGLPAEFEVADVAAAEARLAFLQQIAREPPRRFEEWQLREVPAFWQRLYAKRNPKAATHSHATVLQDHDGPELPLDRAVLVAESYLRRIVQAKPTSGYAQRRAVAVACRVLRAAPQRWPDLVEKVLERAWEQLKRGDDLPIEEQGSLGRLDLAQLDLRLIAAKPPIVLQRGILGATELARWWFLKQQILHGELPSHAAVVAQQNIGQQLSELEGRIWGGFQSVERSILWRTTGTLGHAYRVLLGGFLGGLPPDQANLRDSAHTIACLQLACDLRLSLLRRSVEFSFTTPMARLTELKQLWQLPLRREILLAALRDATLLTDSASRRDPFLLSVAELARGERPSDFTGETLANLLQVQRADPSARTAAFCAVRLATGITEEVLRVWQKLRTAQERLEEQVGAKDHKPSIGQIFDPHMDIKDWTRRLRTLPVGQAILGMFVGAMDTIWCALCWNDGQGTQERLASSAPGVASQASCLLLDLTTATEGTELQQRWRRLQGILQPLLDSVLGGAASGAKLHLLILAPGAFRALPWVGLHMDERPLWDAFGSVSLLPALGLPGPRWRGESTLKTACWLAGCDMAEGETRFGQAAVKTLRQEFSPQWILDVHDVEQMLPIHSLLKQGGQVECLRLYGMDSYLRDTGTAASFNCGRGQVFSPLQLIGPLPRCQLAEVWAATAGWSEQELLGRDDADLIPGVAGVLLAHGVGLVLDLAWPVPDLIKALVCEIYTCYRELTDFFPAQALSMAIGQTKMILNEWYRHRESFTSIREALAWLDEERKQHYGGRPMAGPRFTAFADIPLIDDGQPADFIAGLCAPVHLAAFRFWGG